MKYALKIAYKALSKKQKGIIIQAILSNQDFTKSKEWLRKYLSGAYNKLDEKVEEIGINALKKLGALPQTFSPFRLDDFDCIKSKSSFESKKNSPIEKPKTQSFEVFQEIFDNHFNSFSNVKVGQAWFRFGRTCCQNLSKINPFKIMTHLVQNEEKRVDIEVIEELKSLYELNINSTKEHIYMPAWELFSQKSRFVYSINPFRSIQSIIQNNLN